MVVGGAASGEDTRHEISETAAEVHIHNFVFHSVALLRGPSLSGTDACTSCLLDRAAGESNRLPVLRRKGVPQTFSPCPQVYISSKSWAGPGAAPEGARRNIRRLPAFQGLTPEGSALFAQDQVLPRCNHPRL